MEVVEVKIVIRESMKDGLAELERICDKQVNNTYYLAIGLVDRARSVSDLF